MVALNKKALAEMVAEKNGLTKKKATEIVESVFDTIADSLKDGDTVDITGFGKFEVKQRAPRIGINPQTKEKIEIPPTNVPGFKASRSLKGYVR